MKRILSSNTVNVAKHHLARDANMNQNILRYISAKQFKKRVSTPKWEKASPLSNSNNGRSRLEQFRSANSHRVDRVATATTERTPKPTEVIAERSNLFSPDNPIEHFMHTLYTSIDVDELSEGQEKVDEQLQFRVECFRGFKLFKGKLDSLIHRLTERKKTISRDYIKDQDKVFSTKSARLIKDATSHIERLYQILIVEEAGHAPPVSDSGIFEQHLQRALNIERLTSKEDRKEELMKWWIECIPDRMVVPFTETVLGFEKYLLNLKPGQQLRISAYYFLDIKDDIPIKFPGEYLSILNKCSTYFNLSDESTFTNKHLRSIQRQQDVFKKSLFENKLETGRKSYFPMLMQTLIGLSAEKRKAFVHDVEKSGLPKVADDIKYYYLNFMIFRRSMQALRKRQKLISMERQKVSYLIPRNPSEMTTDIGMTQLLRAYVEYAERIADDKKMSLDQFETYLYEGGEDEVMFDFGFYSMYFFEDGEIGWDEHRTTGFRVPSRSRESLSKRFEVDQLIGRVKEISQLYRLDQTLLNDQLEILRRLYESGELDMLLSGTSDVLPMPISDNDKSDLTVQTFVKNLTNVNNVVDRRFSRPDKIRANLFNDQGTKMIATTREEMLRLRNTRTNAERTPQVHYRPLINQYRILGSHHTDFEEHLVDMSRVVQQQKTGRSPSFRATILIGHKNGMVGFGNGKGTDPMSAMNTARRNAFKNIRSYDAITSDPRGIVRTRVRSKYRSSLLIMTPSPYEAVAAHPMLKTICGYLGITHCAIKLYRSKKLTNIVPNFFKALDSLYSQEFERAARGKMSIPRFEKYYGNYVENAQDLSKYGYSHNNIAHKKTHHVTF